VKFLDQTFDALGQSAMMKNCMRPFKNARIIKDGEK